MAGIKWVAATFALAMGAGVALAQEAAPSRVGAAARQVGTEPRWRGAGISTGFVRTSVGGAGWAPLIGLRLEADWTPRAIGELGVAAARLAEAGRRSTVSVIEYSVQRQRSSGSLRPYIGGGAGLFAIVLNNDDGGFGVTRAVSLSAGTRYRLSPRLNARGELRVRSIGRIVGGSSSTEWSLGIAHRF